MTFGQKLKQLRTSKFLTQKDLAEKLNVSFQTVSKWESDINEPDLATLKEIAKILECSFEELLSSEEKAKGLAEQEMSAQEPAPTVIIRKEAHVCSRCGKDIDEDEFKMEQIEEHSGMTSSFRTVYFHNDCYEKKVEEDKAREVEGKKKSAKKGRWICYGWSTLGAIVALAVTIAGLLISGQTMFDTGASIGLGFAAAYVLFATIYCILSGTYISDVFWSVSSWSIRFPGLIFNWSIDGFMWLIGMKILFWILGAILGVLVTILAVVLSALLSVVSFPFGVWWAEYHKYEDTLFI